MPTMIPPLPRELGQLVVDTKIVEAAVRAQLHEHFGLTFPADEDSSVAHSQPIFTVPYDATTVALLTEKGYKSYRLSGDTIRVSKGGALDLREPSWDFCRLGEKKDWKPKFDFQVWLSIPQQYPSRRMMGRFRGEVVPSEPENTVSLRLETRPFASNGNHEQAVELAQIFEEAGLITQTELTRRLCEANGKIELKWEDIGLEASESMEKFFIDFVQLLADGERNPIGDFVGHLAMELDFSPLDPAPYYEFRSSLDHRSNILFSPSRIPESARPFVHARWIDQLCTFGETRLPRRPS